MNVRTLSAAALTLALSGGLILSVGCMNSTKQVNTDPDPKPNPKPKPTPDGKADDPSNAALYEKAGQHKVNVSIQGETVPVDMFVPKNRKSNTLVVAMHGGGGNGPGHFRNMQYGPFMEKQGVVVMAPTAEKHAETGKTRWDTGNLDDVRRDDLQMLENLAKAAKASGKIDRVVAIGFSNGAQMTNRWACEGTQLDAFVAAAGTLAVDPKNCKRPIPNLTYVGDKDHRMTESPARDGSVPSVKDSMALWKRINKCKDGPPTSKPMGKMVCHSWDCETPTQMCVVKGLGHIYPTPKNSGVDANAQGWDFVQG